MGGWVLLRLLGRARYGQKQYFQQLCTTPRPLSVGSSSRCKKKCLGSVLRKTFVTAMGKFGHHVYVPHLCMQARGRCTKGWLRDGRLEPQQQCMGAAGLYKPAATSRGQTPKITLGCDKRFLKLRGDCSNPFPIDSSMFRVGPDRRSRAIRGSGNLKTM